MSERITVVGAGGIGGNLAGSLALAGERVQLVEVGAHLQAIRERGLRLIGLRGEHVVHFDSVVAPAELRGPLSLVFIATRSQRTTDALDTIAPLVSADGMVVSVQNGLNAHRIAARLGAPRTIPCMVHVVGALEEPGVVGRYSEGEFYVGEYDGTVSERVRALASRMEPAARTHATENVWGFQWTKILHVAQNLATGLVDAPAAEVRSHAWVRRLLVAVQLEVVDAAIAEGVTLERYERIDPAILIDLHTPDGLTQAIDMLPHASEKGYNGTWRELKRGGPTETFATADELVRIGQRHGLSMPLMATLRDGVRAIELGTDQQGWHHLERLRDGAERAIALRLGQGSVVAEAR